jgi:hypothetical protein
MRRFRLRFLDPLFRSARLARARQRATEFDTPAEREAAERVLLFLENVAGIRADQVDLEAEVSSLVAPGASDEFWQRQEGLARVGVRAEHALANLRYGSVRHMVQHLTGCPSCQRRWWGGAR